jgi:hypothetical protein
MHYILIIACCILIAITLLIATFMLGFNYALKQKAKTMIDDMYMGTIIFDFSRDADEPVKCQFEKSPREMMNKDFILMEVKIRQ